jgi:hypothetical protein
MLAAEGALLSASGCLLMGNTQAGVSMWDPDTKTDLLAVVVRGTMPDEDGELGTGIVVQEGASASIGKSLLAQNATAGAMAVDGGLILLESSAVYDTQKGGSGTGRSFQVFGDGIVAEDGAEVDVAATVLAGNGRNGIFFDQSQGSLAGSLVTDNEFYGLAMEKCADRVDWEGTGNYVFGNATGLPPDLAVQVTTSTGGMPVPPAPEMIELPSGPAE